MSVVKDAVNAERRRPWRRDPAPFSLKKYLNQPITQAFRRD
jgi:hypothetical protein